MVSFFAEHEYVIFNVDCIFAIANCFSNSFLYFAAGNRCIHRHVFVPEDSPRASER